MKHNKPVIGLVAIGQTPRRDLTADYETLWGDSFDIFEAGALDGLGSDEINGLIPSPGESDFVTLLADGSTVYVSHERLVPHVQAAVDRVAGFGAAIAVVQCTGEFQCLKPTIPLLFPSKVLRNTVACLLAPGSKITVIVPTEVQAGEAEERWRSRGFEPRTTVVHPFGDMGAAVDRLLGDEATMEAAAIVADCYGFTACFFRTLAERYRKPIFLPRILIAKLLTGVLTK
jgi:protein AroM